jgi:phosphate transport system protein
MSDKHLSSQFDSELHSVSTRVMELGGLVESQLPQRDLCPDPLQR